MSLSTTASRKTSTNPKTLSDTKSKSSIGMLDFDPNFHRGSQEFRYPNGDRYVGEFCAHSSGLVWKEGKGSYYTNDEQIYEGTWYDDKLVQGEPVKITFKNGVVFEGSIDNFKYNGPGCLTLPGNLKIIADFADNKPSGQVILLDHVGKFWYGKAEDEYTIFYPENVFYHNIPLNRGKGKSRIRKLVKDVTIPLPDEEKPIDMEALRKKVFKKSEKLKEDYNFEDAYWYKNYMNFKKKQQDIMGKLKKGLASELSDDEFDWYMKYQEFKDKYVKFMVKRKLKPTDAVDLTLLNTFYSEEYQSSVPEFIIYPSKKKGD